MRNLASLVAMLALSSACRTTFQADPFDQDADGYTVGEDCDDSDPLINPDSPEICDEVDNNCNGAIDEGVTQAWHADSDGDGFGGTQFSQDACSQPAGYVDNASDCDDLAPAAYPGATEVCDGVDNDCNGQVDEGFTSAWFVDADGDGFGNPAAPVTACGGGPSLVSNADDCNDGNPNAWPGATEICDGQDQDCDGQPDNGLNQTWYVDNDKDGFGSGSNGFEACSPGENGAAVNGDCDDADPSSHPGAAELCDGHDNDCNNQVDDGLSQVWYRDADTDGFGDPTLSQKACEQPAGFLLDGRDCNDEASDVHPGAPELCDGRDNNCDDQVDEGASQTFYADADADGYGRDSGTLLGCVLPNGYATQGGDCDDNQRTVNPGQAEVCDHLDNDCNGQIDEAGLSTWYFDGDLDGYGGNGSAQQACDAPSSAHTTQGGDCDDSSAARFPGNAEACDGVDNDCDAIVDEGVTLTVYADTDADSFGDANAASQRCSAGGGYVTDATDCDDTNALANPGAAEVCDGADNNCDHQIDEGVQVQLYVDSDADTYGAGPKRLGCAPGVNESLTRDDCNDADRTIHPGATDLPGDGIDQNCDGIDPTVTPGSVCYAGTSVLTLGEQLEARLETTDQTGGPRGSAYRFDDHEIVLDQGKEYTFSLNSESIDTYLYVLDDTCAVVASVDDGARADLNSALTYTPTKAGVYTVIASSFWSADTGAYRLRVSEGDAANACLSDDRVIGIGEETTFSLYSFSSTDGPIPSAAYRDYGIWLQAGEAISAQVTSEVLHPYVAILDSTCAVVTSNKGLSYTDNARVAFTPPKSGYYTVVAGTDTPGELGELTLQVAGGFVGYQCFGDNAVATLPALYDAAQLSSGDNHTTGPLGTGYTWDDYEVIAGPARGVAAHLASPNLPLLAEAYDDQCNVMSMDFEDTHTFSDTQGLHAQPSEWTQIVTIAVTAMYPGDLGTHALSLAPMTAWDDCGVDARGLTAGETVHEVLTASDATASPHTGYAWDDYELYLQAGETVYLSAGSATDDVGVAVLDSTCDLIAQNNDGGGGTAAYLPFTAPTTGVYTVAVSGELPRVGDIEYYLQASPAPLASTCWADNLMLPPGGGVYPGTLSSLDDQSGQRTIFGTHYHDDVNVYLYQGQQVQLDLNASWDTYLMLLDDSCVVVASNDDVSYPTNKNSRITYTAPASGVYTVIASSFTNNVTGNYTLSTTQLNEF